MCERDHNGGVLPRSRNKLPNPIPTPVEVPLSRLHPAPWNPRTITSERFRNLCQSIQSDPGFLKRRPILAQKDGTVYAGNMRLRAAEHLGLATVPAIIEDVPDRLAKERALRDNAQWGDWLDDDLGDLVQSLQEEGADLSVLGFEDDRLIELLADYSPATPTDPDDAPPLPEMPTTQPSDLWVLGQHRLRCGDSTNTDDLDDLMDGTEAALVWTDPPYGVSYVGGTKKALTIANDSADGLAQLLHAAFANADRAMTPGAPFYVCHPSGPLSLVFGNAITSVGWKLHQTLVWAKDTMVLGRCDYHYRHEPLLYGWKTGDRHRWYGGRSQVSVFDVPRPKASAEHPTMKPVALVEQHLANSSAVGDVILDPFLGSGTTLIAAERSGRRCFGMELEPRYVDVAVRRWEAYSGRKGVRRG